jgi:nickel/cobalt transporter (NicO) family protein
MRRRGRLALATAIGLLALAAPGALAHPLGNFSINHLTRVKVSEDRIELRYLLDQAEIPSFRDRGTPLPKLLRRNRAEALRGLALTVDGRRTALRPAPGGTIDRLDGQGGLETTRVELAFVARVERPSHVRLHDGTFPGRVGWKAIVSVPGEGTAVRASAPSGDPTNGLRSYPEGLLKSPLDRREASFSVRPGEGTLVAPHSEGGRQVTTRSRGGDGFAGVFDDAASGEGVLLLLLLAAFGWGAFHALSPGHGKAMVAAYLVGTRGTARHAVALGATVTVTHTAGVFALGLVTLLLSQYVLPEDLYPWLTLASGLLVVTVGLGVLRSRLRGRRAHHHNHHGHEHDEVTWMGLIGMGASAGLIPCPSALVVLLGAISQHEVGLGLVLITAFSVGLAATLTALGLAVVYARRLTARIRFTSGIATALPAMSAVLIVGVGCVLTAQAIPQVV